MAVGQGTQVLVTCLEQRPLGIEDIEKTEFAQLKALGCVVVGQLRPGQHLAPQGFEFKPAIAQPLTGLQDITSKPDPQGSMFIPRLVFPLEGFEEVAAVTVDDGNRDRHAYEELVSAKFLGAFHPDADRWVRNAPGTLQSRDRSASCDLNRSPPQDWRCLDPLRDTVDGRHWRKRIDVSLCTFESWNRIAPEPCQSLTGDPQLTLRLG